MKKTSGKRIAASDHESGGSNGRSGHPEQGLLPRIDYTHVRLSAHIIETAANKDVRH
ncbi:MAG: hypothetical protein P8L79_13390 [Rhodospirillaceae bacterium]|jgi:hypothetical protein|nr:hypothetical protein [Rhodospirillaceae bacterium]